MVTTAAGNTGKRRWLTRFVRAGYVAKGIVYAAVGVLAAGTAAGWFANEVGGTRNALDAIGDQPFGLVLTGVLVAGLAGYAAWRFTQAVLDPEGKGRGVAGWLRRGGYAISGLLYAGLALYASMLPRTMGADGTEDAVRTALSVEFGWVLLLGAGIGFFSSGLYEGAVAVKQDFKDYWYTDRLAKTTETFVTRLAQIGILVHALLFLIIGWSLALAALNFEPDAARGLGEALSLLRSEVPGQWLLIAVSIGLVLYGVYCFVDAACREIEL